MYAANVQGTGALLAACAAAGVRRVIHTSTIGTVGRLPGGAPPDEMVPFSLWDRASHYVRSKYLGELAARSWNGAGLEIVIVKPTAPVGAGDGRPSATGRRILAAMRGEVDLVPARRGEPRAGKGRRGRPSVGRSARHARRVLYPGTQRGEPGSCRFPAAGGRSRGHSAPGAAHATRRSDGPAPRRADRRSIPRHPGAGIASVWPADGIPGSGNVVPPARQRKLDHVVKFSASYQLAGSHPGRPGRRPGCIPAPVWPDEPVALERRALQLRAQPFRHRRPCYRRGCALRRSPARLPHPAVRRAETARPLRDCAAAAVSHRRHPLLVAHLPAGAQAVLVARGGHRGGPDGRLLGAGLLQPGGASLRLPDPAFAADDLSLAAVSAAARRPGEGLGLADGRVCPGGAGGRLLPLLRRPAGHAARGYRVGLRPGRAARNRSRVGGLRPGAHRLPALAGLRGNPDRRTVRGAVVPSAGEHLHRVLHARVFRSAAI